jgi:hypothetical protein
MLRKLITLTLIVTLVTTSLVYASAASREVPVTLAQGAVTLNDMRFVEHEFEPYPFVFSADGEVVYIPLTFYMLNLMNLTLSQTADGGFAIATGDPEVPKPFAFQTPLTTPNSANLTATVIQSRITINGNVINNANEPYPLLLLREVVYLPLSDRFIEAFGWGFFMNRTGLNVFELIDSSFYLVGDDRPPGYGASATPLVGQREAIVKVDGEFVEFYDQWPMIVDGRTLVPVRCVFEHVGFNVEWDESIRQVTLTSDEYVVILTIDSAEFTTNGIVHTLDVPAQIVWTGRTMLPIRAVLESVGYYVDWDSNVRTVIVSSTPIS